MRCFVSFLCIIIWGRQGRQHYPACCQGFPASLAVPGTLMIWHQIEGPEGRDHLEAHLYNLGVAGGMGCPCERSHCPLLGCGKELVSPAVCLLLMAAFAALTKSSLKWWSLRECTASRVSGLVHRCQILILWPPPKGSGMIR